MKAPIVKIGNSRGIRIPKPFLDQCGFKNEVEIDVENHKLVLRPSTQARASWEDSFKSMAQKGDDTLHVDYESVSNDWDQADWEWK